MDQVRNGLLTEILRREVQDYAGDTLTPTGPSKSYYTENARDQVYCLTVPHTSPALPAELIIMARIVGDQVIIDIDNTNKPLADALQQAGVPSEQIVLAWLSK